MGSSLAWNCYEPALLEVVVDGCIAFGPMDHLYDSVPESSNVQQIWDCLLDRIEETPDQQESWLLEYLVGCLFNFEPGQKPARDRISTQHRSHMRRIADLVNAVFQSVALEISGLLQYGGLSGFGHELDYGAFLIHKSFAVASTRGSMRPFVNVGAQKEHTKVFAEDVCRFFAAGIRTRRIALLGNNPRYFDPYHFLALKLGIRTHYRRFPIGTAKWTMPKQNGPFTTPLPHIACSQTIRTKLLRRTLSTSSIRRPCRWTISYRCHQARASSKIRNSLIGI
ncbi:hypothetical protein ANO11243_067860 [Dothideomycetidae sp. 11243]|nr:hypothetical protein ANO11243_067860 [fungal sp. No.11243]